MSSARRSPARKKAVAAGFRSGFEQTLAGQLDAAGAEYEYEKHRVVYFTPEAQHTYTPDWRLANGILIESKGIFSAADRRKHLLVQEQHPELDIRLVFQNANAKISKKSKMTYSQWCSRNGFQFAHKTIPAEWLAEQGDT